MSKKCNRCEGEKFLRDARCAACNTTMALNYYYQNRAAILAKGKARREMIKKVLAAHNSYSGK